MKTVAALALAALASCTSSPKSTASEPAAEAPALGEMQVIPLKFAAAADVAHALDGVRPAARVIAIERTNSVIVTCASAAELAQVEAAIADLDVRVQ